jgi:spermidine/putrescine ABC transporter ATP-binding subunit
MSNIIELQRLSKSFPAVGRAVDDLTLSVRAGEFVTLLGPSGCGKTTTLRLIAGFEYPDLGTVKVNDQDITDLPPHRRPVNTVFQDYALFPHMTVERNVGYGLWIKRLPRTEISKRVHEILDMVGLADKALARPSELSGGQKQRVALARAIVRKPKVLLLDEPLSALDAKLREAMQVELKHLHQHLGITFLLVTHDQIEAMVMSDRIVIMEKGRVLQDGAPIDLYNRPTSIYVANFLGTSNLLPGTVIAANKEHLTVKIGEVVFDLAVPIKSCRAGDQVVIAIRPEKAEIIVKSIVDMTDQPLFIGKMIDHHFHGNTLRSEIDLGFDYPFLVDTPLKSSTSCTQLVAPGSPCQVRIDQHSAIVFPKPMPR